MNRETFLAGSAALAASLEVTRPAYAQAGMKLRIAAAANDGFAEAFYAQDMGFFARNGIDAEITTFTGGAQVANGVASGALDIGISNVISLANATIHGLPFVYIAAGGMYNSSAPTLALCTAKNSTITDAKQLEGMTVSVSGIKDMAHLVLVAYLTKGGANPAKVNIIELPFPLVSAALARGTIVAGIIAEPALAAAIDDVRVLAKPMDLVGSSMMIAGWFVSTDWQKKNVALAHTFAQTIYQTARWANANQDKSGIILRKYAKIEDATARKMVRVIYGESLNLDMIDPTLELAAREGFTSRRVHASEMVANAFAGGQ